MCLCIQLLIHKTQHVKSHLKRSWPGRWIDSEVRQIFKLWRGFRKNRLNHIGGWEGCVLCGMTGRNKAEFLIASLEW